MDRVTVADSGLRDKRSLRDKARRIVVAAICAALTPDCAGRCL